MMWVWLLVWVATIVSLLLLVRGAAMIEEYPDCNSALEEK